jgi:hypothetical protein
METTIHRQHTSFRLSNELLDRLRLEAKKANRSLNSYVEMVLTDVILNSPNAETIEAIEEARSGKYRNDKPVDMSSPEAMMKSLLV